MVEEIFTALGTIILIGFLGRAAYHRTRIPESVLMVLIGLLIGPGLGIVKAEVLLPLLPFISILALVLVLLDAGLEFNVFKVMKGMGGSLAFTLLVALFVTGLIGLVLHFFLGWELFHGILVGLISSGTTTVAVMALIELTKTEAKTRNLLFLESVVNDFVLILGGGSDDSFPSASLGLESVGWDAFNIIFTGHHDYHRFIRYRVLAREFSDG